MAANEHSTSSVPRRTVLVTIQSNALAYGGLAFMLASFASLVVLMIMLYGLRGMEGVPVTKIETPADYQAYTLRLGDHYLKQYLPPLLLLLSMLVSAAVGYLLLRAAGTASKQVIPPQDYELLSKILVQSKEKGIDHYVRLSSLTGITGLFTKVGLAGLPLATIGLTVVFTILALWSSSLGTQFFDLAKLTLGAFLGSFVQRKAGEMEKTTQ